jgi:hypothetical protein
MMPRSDDFESFCVDTYPIDTELGDDGAVGPELAHLAQVYVRSPRALVWRNPSSDWRLFVVLLPLASRLSLIANPIFAQLARAWGLNIRFIGIGRDQLVYDFRALLSDKSIKLLVDALARSLSSDSNDPPRSDQRAMTAPSEGALNPALDVLFSALAGDLLTIVSKRRDDWGRHLLREHVLTPDVARSLFDRNSRFPDFLGKLREALRHEIIDAHFYGKVLRSIDLRETAVEQRLAALIEASLDPITFTKLARTEASQHLGCYNWLRLDLRHAAARAHALTRLPTLSNFFADALVTLETLEVHAGDDDDDERDVLQDQQFARSRKQAPTLDLRGLAARSETTHSLRWSAVLKQAIDAGQDRNIIEALAQRFAVSDNVIRRLWREPPKALGAPPTWHLTQILRRLNELPEREWPVHDRDWQTLAAHAVPAEAG